MTVKYGGTLRDLIVQSDNATRTIDPDVGAWFKAADGRVGQCVGSRPNWLLIRFDSGVKRWRRREDLRFVAL